MYYMQEEHQCYVTSTMQQLCFSNKAYHSISMWHCKVFVFCDCVACAVIECTAFLWHCCCAWLHSICVLWLCVGIECVALSMHFRLICGLSLHLHVLHTLCDCSDCCCAVLWGLADPAVAAGVTARFGTPFIKMKHLETLFIWAQPAEIGDCFWKLGMSGQPNIKFYPPKFV